MSKSIKTFFKPPSNENGPNKKSKVTSVDSVTVEVAGDDQTSIVLKETPSDADLSDADWLPCDNIESVWKSKLEIEFTLPYFVQLRAYLQLESKSHSIFPPRSQIFSAFNLCPFDKVKVVVIGQDPYHGAGQAHGLAFSVQRGVVIPPSLRNMIKELTTDPNSVMNKPGHGNLEHWSEQGVLMLNNVLTVRKADANSHQKHGWEQFTDAVVRELGRREGLVYLLWGKPAQVKCKNIDATKNTIITSSHPSPLAAYKTDEPFIGSRCFSRCNDALVARGQTPIDWTIR